jgi:hypothetical protein
MAIQYFLYLQLKLTPNHMKLMYSLLYVFLLSIGQKTSLDYYLPQNGSYNTKIPQSILNFELGEMHTDHTQ